MVQCFTHKAFLRLAVTVSFLTALSGCVTEPEVLLWEGVWQRTINVPKDFSGRCYQERLTVDGMKWSLHGVLHATEYCDKPYLELDYSGVLQEVHVKKGSNDRQLSFKVKDITLVGMTDLSGARRNPLSENAVANIADKYVASHEKALSQQVSINNDNTVMQSTVFYPLMRLAIPSVKAKQLKNTDYRRI